MLDLAIEPGRAAKPNEIAAFLELHRQELLGLLSVPAAAGVKLAHRRSEVMGRLLGSIFETSVGVLAPTAEAPVVLGAVGGFGRGLLGWKSDLDVRLITDLPERIQPLTESLLYPLWDAGVSIGHQVASIDDLIEAARHDLPTATSLLDFRRLAGDTALVRRLEGRVFGG